MKSIISSNLVESLSVGMIGYVKSSPVKDFNVVNIDCIKMLPTAFHSYMKYTETPEYKYIKSMFNQENI